MSYRFLACWEQFESSEGHNQATWVAHANFEPRSHDHLRQSHRSTHPRPPPARNRLCESRSARATWSQTPPRATLMSTDWQREPETPLRLLFMLVSVGFWMIFALFCHVWACSGISWPLSGAENCAKQLLSGYVEASYQLFHVASRFEDGLGP